MKEKLLPVDVVRDAAGYFIHPMIAGMYWDEGTPAEEVNRWYLQHGVYTTFTSMWDDDEQTESITGMETAKDWEPPRPEGEGWFLISVFDGEDGPVAQWAHPIDNIPAGYFRLDLDSGNADFTTWYMRDGVVVDCQPFQGTVWVNSTFLRAPAVGEHPVIMTKRAMTLTLNYPVTKITPITEKAECEELDGIYLGWLDIQKGD